MTKGSQCTQQFLSKYQSCDILLWTDQSSIVYRLVKLLDCNHLPEASLWPYKVIIVKTYLRMKLRDNARATNKRTVVNHHHEYCKMAPVANMAVIGITAPNLRLFSWFEKKKNNTQSDISALILISQSHWLIR